MFHLTGKTKDGRRLLAIGIPKKFLKGLTNANMCLTLDAVIGAKMAEADYVCLLQANSARELEQKMSASLLPGGGKAEAYAAGVVEEPEPN